MLLAMFQLSVTGVPADTVDKFAAKLLIVGGAPVGTFAGVKIVRICTTSKFDAAMFFSKLRSLLFQRSSGAPLMKMALPLSARIMPYSFRAVRTTLSSAR